MNGPVADLSVLTLVRNRNELLARLIAGLAGGGSPPRELVVAWCGGEDPHAVVPEGLAFEVQVLEVGHGGERIPYAEARNACAAAASASNLAFLDADCIPGPAYASALGATLDEVDALATGEVWYLPPDRPADFDPATLRSMGRAHPHRERPPVHGWRRSDHHEQVWGLHLALRKTTFLDLGGFDEDYQGYAGEDTDLAVTARAAGVPVALVAGAEVFHQHHDSWEPPLQQLRATIANATTFRRKWGRWPMEGWLAELDGLGFIAWDPAAAEVAILRDPDEQDLAAARQGAALPFRTT